MGTQILHFSSSVRVLNSITASLHRHPKRLASSVAVLLLGTAVTAFGVVPLAPDAANLPVHQVLEAVQALPLQAQLDALVDHRFKLFRTDNTRSSDTFDTLLKRPSRLSVLYRWRLMRPTCQYTRYLKPFRRCRYKPSLMPL